MGFLLFIPILIIFLTFFASLGSDEYLYKSKSKKKKLKKKQKEKEDLENKRIKILEKIALEDLESTNIQKLVDKLDKIENKLESFK